MERLVSIPEAAKRLDVAPKTIHKWRKAGLIPVTILPGSTMKIKESVLDAWVEKRTLKAKQFVAA